MCSLKASADMSYKQGVLFTKDENQMRQIHKLQRHTQRPWWKAGGICSNKCLINSLCGSLGPQQLINRPVKYNVSDSWEAQGYSHCCCEIHLKNILVTLRHPPQESDSIWKSNETLKSQPPPPPQKKKQSFLNLSGGPLRKDVTNLFFFLVYGSWLMFLFLVCWSKF